MKKIIFAIMRFSGLTYLFREFVQKYKTTIILLHDIDVTTAEMTFEYLKKKYALISLDTYIHAVKNRTKLPPKAMVITFDDGHIVNYELLPIIKKLNIPVTIFLCASIIDTNRQFWFQYNELPMSAEKLKKKKNHERLKILKKAGFDKNHEYDSASALQRKHIEEMRSYINFQAHAMYHPIFPKCDDDEVRTEIFGTKEVLENKFGLAINAIAYPNGDYCDRTIKLSKEAGYQCGLTVEYGFNDQESDLFTLKRLGLDDSYGKNELIAKASGLWDFIKTRNGRKQTVGKTEKVVS